MRHGHARGFESLTPARAPLTSYRARTRARRNAREDALSESSAARVSSIVVGGPDVPSTALHAAQEVVFITLRS